MRRFGTVGVGIVSLLVSVFVMNCGSPPKEEMKEAERLLRSAKKAWADKYAPEELKRAEQTFANAQAKVEAKEYEAARETALQAQEQAKDAKSAAKRKTARLERDGVSELDRATAVLGETKGLFEQLQAKITGEPLDALKTAMTSVDSKLSQAGDILGEGEFTESQNISVDVTERAVQLRQEIWDAAEAAVLKADPNDRNEFVVIETQFGRIVFGFFPDVARNHVANFKKLAKTGFYDGTTFHRVIPGFMIQGGDPNTKDDDRRNDGRGGPGYLINAEFNNKKHVRGTVSMARGGDPNSAGSQFFICVAKQSSLDSQYTAFGQVIEGMEVADQIAKQTRDGRNNPLERIEMKVSIVDRSKV